MEDPRSEPVSIKVSYEPGPRGFAGVYWMNRERNWCYSAGDDFSNGDYRKLTFWARGAEGGEVVEFKAGGISCEGKESRDSFSVTTGKIPLTREWKKYEIDLTGQDLSSVIGGFCWVAEVRSNSKSLIFYLDDIHYEC